MAIPINAQPATLVASPTRSSAADSVSPAEARSVPGVPTPQADTVKISLSAHIHQLKGQGQGEHQIAATLGVPVSSLSSYFIQPAVAAPSPKAVAPVPVVPSK